MSHPTNITMEPNQPHGSVPAVCVTCGKTYAGKRYRPNRFCSRKCMGIHTSTLVGAKAKHWKGGHKRFHTCRVCGGSFYARTDRKRRYCSYPCAGEAKRRLWAKKYSPGLIAYRAKLKAAGPWPLPERVREAIKATYGYTCPQCKRAEPFVELTMDHVIPVSAGGSNHPDNIQPLCRTCNTRKRGRIIRYAPVTEVAS